MKLKILYFLLLVLIAGFLFLLLDYFAVDGKLKYSGIILAIGYPASLWIGKYVRGKMKG